MGHAATLATDRVFNAFYDDSESRAFMHGPTFMGNPLACSVALASIDLFEQNQYLDRILKIEAFLAAHFTNWSPSSVKACRVLGAMAAIEVHSESDLVGFSRFAIDRGVWLRPFGPYCYTMPAYTISDEELFKVVNVMTDWFNQKG